MSQQIEYEGHQLLQHPGPQMALWVSSPSPLEEGERAPTGSSQDERYLTEDGNEIDRLFHEDDYRPYPFATEARLRKYIPELDHNDPRARTLKVKLSERSVMLKLQLLLAVLVVILNVAIVVWAVRSHPPDSRGIAILSLGNCETIGTVNSVIHIGLNVISTLFLAAGNYCMQVLVAPSRREIDRAHENGTSLDIGVQSIKNLWRIQARRRYIWLLLCFLSTMLHFCWNSAFFTSRPYVSYPHAVATSDFLEASGSWSLQRPVPPPIEYASDQLQSNASVYDLQSAAKGFTRLGTKDCIASFIDPLQSTSAVVVVAANLTTAEYNGTSIIDGWISGWDAWTGSSWWLCSWLYVHQDPGYTQWCTEQRLEAAFGDHWLMGWADGVDILVDYCLVGEAGDNDARCGIQYSVHVLILVCICTGLSTILVFWTWLKHRTDVTMVTMGDAIASYLEHPDRSPVDTLGELEDTNRCATNKQNHVLVDWSISRRVSWFSAVSRRVWLISSFFFVLGLAIPTCLLGVSIPHLKGEGFDMSFQAIWKEGFKTNAAFILAGTDGNHVSPLASAFIANSFQVMVSFLYLFYNNILTRQLVAAEWTRFAGKDGKKPLRVSSPVGMQRSSYRLSLPFTFSIPLMLAMILLHWLVSESIFVIQLTGFGPGPDPIRMPLHDTTSLGYSPLGIISSITVGGLLILALFINAFIRRYPEVPPGFPAMGTSSAGIRAMCQRPIEDTDAHLFPVSFGLAEDIRRQGSREVIVAGPLTFSTFIGIFPPEPGFQYLKPVT